jgi:hypothetical protein
MCDSAGALPSGEHGSGATGHVAAPKPFLTGRRVWSCRTHGNIEALCDREARSRAIRHVAASQLSLVGRQGPEPQDT